MTRIIAGLAKGRRLTVPREGTRPTSDRAREGLFNTLSATMSLEGARVLDLFAGTGAVGLEALSRGAETAVLVESNRKALDVLRGNVEAVGLPGARVVASTVERHLAGEPDGRYDLVFADPPYAVEAEPLRAILDRVAAAWLAPDGLVVVERAARDAAGTEAIRDLTTVAEKRYGEALLWYGRAR